MLARRLWAGCASAAPLVPTHLDAAEGYSLSFPDRAETRTGRDGRATFRIDHARTPDDARFEAAWFGFPAAMGADEQAALLSRVERSIGGADAKVTSRESGTFEGRESVDLVVEGRDGRRGFHRVLYPTPRSMLQVSAVGPRGGAWERSVEDFWASLKLGGKAVTVSAADEARSRPERASEPLLGDHLPRGLREALRSARAPRLGRRSDQGRIPGSHAALMVGCSHPARPVIDGLPVAALADERHVAALAVGETLALGAFRARAAHCAGVVRDVEVLGR